MPPTRVRWSPLGGEGVAWLSPCPWSPACLPFPCGPCGRPEELGGGLTLFSWLGMMQRTKLGVVLRSVVISFPNCSLYSCPTVRNMPFLVLEALGSELSVILAIWSSPTMRSTVGTRRVASAHPGALPPCSRPGGQPGGWRPRRPLLTLRGTPPPSFLHPHTSPLVIGKGRCRGLLSKYYIFLRPQELPNDRKNTFSLTLSQRLGSKSCSCHHLGLVLFCALVSPSVKMKVTQSCPTVCNPMDYIVPGILQPEYWSG